MIIRPLLAGVELFAVLRSEDSPEAIDLHIGGDGVSVQTAANPAHGLEVVRDGDVVGRIGRLVAVDADGASVPTSMVVDGTRVRLEVRHRDADVLYPVLADPPYSVTEVYNWECPTAPCDSEPGAWNGRTGWFFEQNAPLRINVLGFQTSGWLGPGRYAEHRSSGVSFSSGEFAYWRFPAPGTMRVVRTSLQSSLASASGTNACLFAGVSAWNTAGQFYWEALDTSMCGEGEPGTCCGEEYLNRTHTFTVPGGLDNNVLSGIHFPDTRARSYFAHHLGYALIELRDDEHPTLATNATTAWRNSPMSVTATDPGSGIKAVTLNGESLYSSNCAVARDPDRCLTTRTFTKTFPEGVTALSGTVTDRDGHLQRYGGGLRAT